jgi:hypothetical protein
MAKNSAPVNLPAIRKFISLEKTRLGNLIRSGVKVTSIDDSALYAAIKVRDMAVKAEKVKQDKSDAVTRKAISAWYREEREAAKRKTKRKAK